MTPSRQHSRLRDQSKASARRPERSCRLIVLGLDGACWQAYEQLSKIGELPNLRRLLFTGTSADLHSIIPPVTGPAWPAVATGLNPGRLGTFDFCNRRTLNDHTLFPIRSHQIRGRTFWDRLAGQGYRTGIFAYPMLVPTYEIDGWMVAGLGASKLQRWVWPSSLAAVLDSIARPYTISVSYGLSKYAGNREKLLDDLGHMFTGQMAALEHLLREHPVDLLVAVFGITDVLSHTMWHLWDPEYPLYDAGQAEKLLPRIYSLWANIDQAIGRLEQHLAHDGHLLIVSDHGFGSSFGVFNANVWLEQTGFLKRRRGNGRLNNRLRSLAVARLSPFLAPLFKGLLGTPAHAVLRESILREIDLERTRAFALETTDLCGMIFINRSYARARNLAEDDFVARTQTELRGRLSKYGQENGLSMEIFLSQDLYSGQYTNLAPELIFIVEDYRTSVSYRLGGDVYEARPHHLLKTGNHRQEGIFLAHGPKIRSGAHISPVGLLDIVPTVYHLLGESVPGGLDGRVSLEAFLPEFRGVKRGTNPEMALELSVAGDGISDGEAKLMRQRLRDLGYID